MSKICEVHCLRRHVIKKLHPNQTSTAGECFPPAGDVIISCQAHFEIEMEVFTISQTMVKAVFIRTETNLTLLLRSKHRIILPD